MTSAAVKWLYYQGNVRRRWLEEGDKYLETHITAGDIGADLGQLVLSSVFRK